MRNLQSTTSDNSNNNNRGVMTPYNPAYRSTYDFLEKNPTKGTRASTVGGSPDLTSLPDLRSIPKMPEAVWPKYMLDNPGVRNDEQKNIEALENYFERSTRSGYFQAHPYGQMHLGMDMKMDELTNSNNYMKLIFGGKPNPERDNIDLAYNNAIRQMAESPVEKDSIIGHQNPAAFVPREECSKDAILETFEKQRQFYKGAIDSDAERFLKARPTHKLISHTCYGKKLSKSGTSLRYNHVRGQADLINRPTELENFKPDGNLSSKTFAPDGKGGEVPLNYENVYGLDPRAVKVKGTPKYDVKPPLSQQQWNFNDMGSYSGADIDRYMFDWANDANPSFIKQFKEFVPRM